MDEVLKYVHLIQPIDPFHSPYRLRKDINNDDANNTKVSVNDFIIKASSLALQDIPEVNSSWMESFVRRYYSSDVSIAVSTEGGLITPIIFNAESKVICYT